MKTSRAIGAEITHTNEGIQLNLARIRKYLTRSFARNTIVISISQANIFLCSRPSIQTEAEQSQLRSAISVRQKTKRSFATEGSTWTRFRRETLL